jgi:hypothetical protein
MYKGIPREVSTKAFPQQTDCFVTQTALPALLQPNTAGQDWEKIVMSSHETEVHMGCIRKTYNTDPEFMYLTKNCDNMTIQTIWGKKIIALSC